MMDSKKCPCGNGCMELKDVEEKTVFKGVDLDIKSEIYVCKRCGIEAGTIKQAAAIQAVIANTYRAKTGLLTGSEINTLRKSSGLTLVQLSTLLGLLESTIKGWETCIVQSRKEDTELRLVLRAPLKTPF
jgi:putative zinc finger/helix-turn-helix YgiT family protein